MISQVDSKRCQVAQFDHTLEETIMHDHGHIADNYAHWENELQFKVVTVGIWFKGDLLCFSVFLLSGSEIFT